MLLRGIAVVLTIGLCSPVVVSGQSADLERQAIDTLRGQIVTLRTFSKSNHLEFDQSGHPKKQGQTGTWTVYGKLLVKKIDVSESRLRLGGERIVHLYDQNQAKLVASRSDLGVDIDIDLKNNATWADVEPAISNIFAGQEGLLPYVPKYWRLYLEGKKRETTSCASSKTLSPNESTANLIKQIPFKYPPESKNFPIQGTVVLEVEINETGDISDLIIVTPAGLGFDESTIEVVSQWKYKPTFLNGAPVCVVTTILVNYHFSR